MTQQVRVGLVGVGIIAETHLQVLAEDSRFSLDFTVDPHKTEPVVFQGAQQPHYTTLGEALGTHDPDLVVVATPTETHAGLAVQALTSSTARVLVEKPLVHDLPALATLRELDGQADVAGRLFTAHHFAFSPEVRWAADQLDTHPEWGPVTGITSAFYATHGSDGRTPRKIAHYRPLYADLVSRTPDAVLGFTTAATITELHQASVPDHTWGR